MIGQQGGPSGGISYTSRSSPHHTINFDDQQETSNELPINSRGCVGCGRRGVIAEVRLGFVGAVAVDVGPRWKGGWVQISISLQVRGSLGIRCDDFLNW